MPPNDRQLAKTVLILGASARPAAFSALRAGLTPQCVDLFGDADLAARCATTAVHKYPSDLAVAVERLSQTPWLYTGGLENHPALVDRIARKHPLLGNRGDVLRQVRNHARVAKVLGEAGLPIPPWQRNAAGLPRDGSWLAKRTDSTGGRHVRRFCEATQLQGRGKRWYFQQFIAGRPCAAVYVMTSGKSTLLGITEQLVGVPWTGAGEFAYCGSIGPLPPTTFPLEPFERLGTALCRDLELVGLVGVDVVVADDQVWPVDVNPRYTASVEVIERATGVRAIARHLEACGGNLSAPVSAEASLCHGKVILYGRSTVAIPAEFTERRLQEASMSLAPPVADTPTAGTIIERGHPVLTLFANGANRTEVIEELKGRVEAIEAELYETAHRR